MLQNDTIAAIATAPGAGGVGIIRISGENALEIAEKISQKIPKPRLATYAEFYDGENLLDEGLILFFPNPKSFTGEDVVELQAHGGPVIMNMLLKTVIKLGARQA
ncbi:MAG: tRNA uridine-5-carboxymethylaminomethyl(34) synthesis GTPase MnmE, partial [Xanthomonadales bacterium]|nr:tRNA uridine-5-carboxymethylaminomethyl(34) synthesis GTPase MnmE [Xanthomonadales bacterium]